MKKLPCQEVLHHAKPAIRPSLPNDMLVCPEDVESRLLDADSTRNRAQLEEFVISLVRICNNDCYPETWAANHTLTSNATVPLMRVGFLPVIQDLSLIVQ